MTFEEALTALKQGKKVARTGWNGKGMFLYLVPGSVVAVSRQPLMDFYEELIEVFYRSHIDMKTVDGDHVPWVASQSDLLSADWEVVA